MGQGASPLPGSHPASAILQSPQEAALHNSSQAMDAMVTRYGQGKEPAAPSAHSNFPSPIQGSTAAGLLNPGLETPASTEQSAGGMAGPSLLASSSLPDSARPPPQEAR